MWSVYLNTEIFGPLPLKMLQHANDQDVDKIVTEYVLDNLTNCIVSKLLFVSNYNY